MITIKCLIRCHYSTILISIHTIKIGTLELKFESIIYGLFLVLFLEYMYLSNNQVDLLVFVTIVFVLQTATGVEFQDSDPIPSISVRVS